MDEVQRRIEEAKENRLKSLDLSDSGLTKIPAAVAEMTWLEVLDLSENEISDLSPLSGLPSLSGLSVSQTQVSDLSPLSGLPSLSGLSVSQTQVSDLSPLSGLPSLSGLSVYQTQVSDLSPLSGLSSLSVLYVSRTQVSDLSPLSGLSSLSRLDVYQTRVSDLSPLSGLSSLSRLSVSRTQVSDLSPLSGLPSLSGLSVSQTQVSDLSPLSGLPSLSGLYVSQTQVSDLSPLLPLLEKKLKDLYFNDCPLVHPPMEIAEKGKAAIIEYLKRLEAQREKETITLREAKVLLVGQGESGKTTLRRKLRNENADMPTEDEMTWGIEIESLDCPVGGGEPMTLHLWDFGGQNIQHFAHQFFLTHHSLYVLLTNERGQNDHFAYWLGIIEMLGGRSPVMVVQNEKAGHLEPIADWAGMKGRYSNLVNPHQVNLKNAATDSRFEKLKMAITTEAMRLGHVGKKYPGTFVRLRQKLREATKKRQYLEWPQYEKMCREAGLEDPLTMGDYATTLTFLGECLHLTEEQDDVLCDFVFLRPRWIIEALYLLLRHERVTAQKGIFSTRDARQIWSGAEYRGMHDKLIRLLLHFHLCYQITHENKYIVPQRLESVGATEPSLGGEEKLPLTVFYHYVFMPKGVLTRLTCRLHQLIPTEGDRQQVWNEAVLLENKNGRARAFVREVYASQKIRIQVTGPDRHDLLNRIVDELDDIHRRARYQNLQVKKLVPCHCPTCRVKTEPHFFDYDYLLRRLHAGKKESECQVSLNDVDIREVLRHIGIKTPLEKMKAEVRELVADHKLDKALERLRAFSAHDPRLVMMHGQRRGQLDDFIFDTQSREGLDLQDNQLSQRILVYLERMDEEGFDF